MPFTFSHPAAVLPLNYLPKKYISLTGLVLGSMAPDFEYFLRLKDMSYYSHTWKGVFWFDLPLVIILAFLYHGLVRDALIDNTPLMLRKKLMRFKNFSWTDRFKKSFIVIIISIIIGTSSHIIWDRFTHAQSSFETLEVTFDIAGHRMPTYKILQYVCTLIGGLIVLYGLFQLPSDKTITQKRNIFPYWTSVTIITAIVSLARFFLIPHYRSYHNFYGDLIVTIISGWLIGLIITPKILPAKYL